MKKEMKTEAEAQIKDRWNGIQKDLALYANRRSRSGNMEITMDDIQKDSNARNIHNWLRNEQANGRFEDMTEDEVLNKWLDETYYINKDTRTSRSRNKPKTVKERVSASREEKPSSEIQREKALQATKELK